MMILTKRGSWWALLVTYSLSACVHSGPATEAPLLTEKKADRGAPASIQIPKADVSQPPREQRAPGSGVRAPNELTCRPFNASVVEKDKPFYVADVGVFVTRVVNGCETDLGEFGYNERTSWMVMGIPCTGAGTRLSWKGNRWSPHVISFPVLNDCPMSPANQGQMRQDLNKALAVEHDLSVMAFHPFALQYWELSDYNDADTGLEIEVRQASATGAAWRKFQEGANYRVRLYGRENAWVQVNHFYEIEAEIIYVAQNRFRLQVLSANVLSDSDVKKVSGRCADLRPRRNCNVVF